MISNQVIEEQKTALLKKHNMLVEGVDGHCGSFAFDIKYTDSGANIMLYREENIGKWTLVESVTISQLNG